MAQPKLNGLRAVFKDGHFFSRSGNRWADTLLLHLLGPLRKRCPKGLILDGEFYRHGWTLDRIAEAVSLFRRTPAADTFEVGFYVFDLVAEAAFEDRCRRYHRLIDGISNVRPVPTLFVRSAGEADAVHEWNLRTGFEGTIYRLGSEGYRAGRCSTLMKRKPKRGSGFVEDREFKVRVSHW